MTTKTKTTRRSKQLSPASQAIASICKAAVPVNPPRLFDEMPEGVTTISTPRSVECPACGAFPGEFCRGRIRLGGVCRERWEDFVLASDAARKAWGAR